MNYQYKLVGAPERGTRRRGTKTGSERVAAAMQEIVAQHAQEGWEFVRTDTLPVNEPRGFFGARRIVMRAVLVFRRQVRQSPAVRESYIGEGAAPPAAPAPAPAAEPLPPRAREPGFRTAPAAPGEPEAVLQLPDDEVRRPFRSPYRDEEPARQRLFEPQRPPPITPAAPDEPAEEERNPRDLSDIREALRKLDR
ncbi:MAG: hypothetical protein AAFR84_17305 [Pseudomonadota bacterium]